MEVEEKPVGLGAGWLPGGGSWPSHCPERSGREGLEEGSGVRQEAEWGSAQRRQGRPEVLRRPWVQIHALGGFGKPSCSSEPQFPLW